MTKLIKIMSLILITLITYCYGYANTSDVIYAPYKDMNLNAHWDSTLGTMVPENISTISQKSGIKHFMLAFIVNANSAQCTPAWGGSYPLYETTRKQKKYLWGSNAINALKQAGGAVTISFGGQAGIYLAKSCSNAANLASAYRRVIDAYQIRQLDFDVEGAYLADAQTVKKMMLAITSLQRQYPSLKVSFTLPVLPTGLTYFGVNFINSAAANGVKVSRVNIMAMDYGPAFNPSNMAVYAEQAARATLSQLKGAYPQATMAMISVTPMIGNNDVSPEHFTLADTKSLVNFAKNNGITQLHSWSVNRDQPCGHYLLSARATCSGSYAGKPMEDKSYAFAHAFMGLSWAP